MSVDDQSVTRNCGDYAVYMAFCLLNVMDHEKLDCNTASNLAWKTKELMVHIEREVIPLETILTKKKLLELL